MSQYVVDPVLRELANDLQGQIDRNSMAIAGGGASTFDDYRHQVGYIAALHSVLQKCFEMDNRRHGPPPGSETDTP